MDREDGLLALGRVIKPHGIGGQVWVQPYGDNPASLEQYHALFIIDPASSRRLPVGEVTVASGRKVLMRVAGVEDRTQAEALVGAELFIESVQLPAPEEGEYYWYQLIGLTVMRKDGEVLGKLKTIFQTGAHDVFVVQGARGEILLPAVAPVIKEVDVAGGKIIVDPPPGLIEVNAL